MVVLLVALLQHPRRIDRTGQLHGGKLEAQLVLGIGIAHRHHRVARDLGQAKHRRGHNVALLHVLLARLDRATDPLDHELLLVLVGRLGHLGQHLEAITVWTHAQSVAAQRVAFAWRDNRAIN